MKSALSIIQDKSCSSVKLNVLSDNQGVSPSNFKGKAAVVTLGCAKNQVDSEVMLGVLRNTGFDIVTELSEADVAIINTCGFLESSVKESIDAVLDAADYKENGRLRRLIVAGCMVERYKGDLVTEFPEVDAFITTDELLRVGEVAGEGVSNLLDSGSRPYFLYDDTIPREIASRRHTAYVKVSEGCNRPCTFCIIPRIRGEMRSREISSVVKEVALLGEQGVREINLVAQDLTSFGKDRGQGDLSELLLALDEAKAVDWIRLLYAYPIGTDEKLLKTIVNAKNVCNYFDVPLQHASESVLKEMKRPIGKFAAIPFVDFIKTTTPEIAIRTTFITGFPGETEKDVKILEDFIRQGYFTNVGIFTYSAEKGTPAGDMKNQIPEDEKLARRDTLMKAQQRVVEERLKNLIGNTLDVLLEGEHEDTDLLYTGRTEFQAPDVDGVVIVNDFQDYSVNVGLIYPVEITETAGYDVIGRIVGEGR